MLRKVNYLDKANIIAQQREAILTKIREMSKSHIIYDGLSQFQDGAPAGITVDPKDVPGLRESGWTPSMVTNPIQLPRRGAEHNFMRRLLSDLQNQTEAWAFQQPVNRDEVEDYYDVIKRPMDLSTMEQKLEANQYPSLRGFIDDAQLIFDNCRQYNGEGSSYGKNATRLEKFMRELIAERMKTEA
jgi:histone acetyltransferase